MGTLTFFPWMTVTEPCEVAGFRLIPIRFPRDEPPEGEVPAESLADVRRILTPYRTPPDVPLGSATLVQFSGKAFTEDLSEEDVGIAFALSETVAFVGLTQREFFAPTKYNNRDTFALVVQRFTSGSGGAAIHLRRRHGYMIDFTPEDFFVVRQEPHVERGDRFPLDAPLVTAIYDLIDSDERWDRAIRLFNEANTDRPSITEAQEVVSMVSAFQRLFDVSSGNVRATRDAFIERMSAVAVQTDPPQNSARPIHR